MKQLWLLAFLPFPLFAATSAPNIDLAATLGSLIFVIALILFFAWLLKRMKVPGMTGGSGGGFFFFFLPDEPFEREEAWELGLGSGRGLFSEWLAFLGV